MAAKTYRENLPIAVANLVFILINVWKTKVTWNKQNFLRSVWTCFFGSLVTLLSQPWLYKIDIFVTLKRSFMISSIYPLRVLSILQRPPLEISLQVMLLLASADVPPGRKLSSPVEALRKRSLVKKYFAIERLCVWPISSSRLVYVTYLIT